MFIQKSVVDTQQIEEFLNYVNNSIDSNYEEVCKKATAEGKQPFDADKYKLYAVVVPMNRFNYNELTYLNEKINLISDDKSKHCVTKVIEKSNRELEALTNAYNSGNLENFLSDNKDKCSTYITRLGQDPAFQKNGAEQVQLTEAGKQVVDIAKKIYESYLNEFDVSLEQLDNESSISHKAK